MRTSGRYLPEHLLLACVFVLATAGFWNLYLAADATPGPHHHLHLVTVFLWLGLMLWQLRLASRQDFAGHRRLGTWILLVAPLLFASMALLSVHSANKGLLSGRGDPLIIQNVMGTLELGLLVFLAFALRKRRALHGAFLLATAILFMGIALFFTLIGFAPAFRIEGPDTFHRFASAAMTGQAVCLAVGLAFMVRDHRNGWPFLLAALFFPLNELIRVALARFDLIEPLTRFVGSLSEARVFAGGFAALLALLLATGIRPVGQRAPSRQASDPRP